MAARFSKSLARFITTRPTTENAPNAPYTSAFINGGVAEGVLDAAYGFVVQVGVEPNVGAMTKFKVDVIAGNNTDTPDGWYALAGLYHDFGSGFELGGQFTYDDFQDQTRLWQVGATASYQRFENLQNIEGPVLNRAFCIYLSENLFWRAACC